MRSRARLARESQGGLGETALRNLVVAGPAQDADVHLHLPSASDANTAAISQGALFRVEAAMAVAAALLLFVTRGWPGMLVAQLVAADGVGAVLLYQYVDLGAFGPFPDMDEPVSYAEKSFSLIVEAVAALAALALLLMDLRRRRALRPPGGVCHQR